MGGGGTEGDLTVHQLYYVTFWFICSDSYAYALSYVDRVGSVI